MKSPPRPFFCCLKYSSLFGFYGFIDIKVRSLRSEAAGVLKSRSFQPGTGSVFSGSVFLTLNFNLSSGWRGNPERIPNILTTKHVQSKGESLTSTGTAPAIPGLSLRVLGIGCSRNTRRNRTLSPQRQKLLLGQQMWRVTPHRRPADVTAAPAGDEHLQPRGRIDYRWPGTFRCTCRCCLRAVLVITSSHAGEGG